MLGSHDTRDLRCDSLACQVFEYFRSHLSDPIIIPTLELLQTQSREEEEGMLILPPNQICRPEED